MVQYYIKFFNTKTGKLVGYYKEKGLTSISKMKKGIKMWDTAEEAYEVCKIHDNSFIRDEDKHYYLAHAVVYGEPGFKSHNKPQYELQNEEERKNEVDAFIRQNYSRIRE